MNLKEYIIQAVAGAAALAVGGTAVSLTISDARQNDRIERVESLADSVEGLRDDLGRVEQKIERLDGKLEGQATR